jgi:predicted transglutaminase-like cysteine proteinase
MLNIMILIIFVGNIYANPFILTKSEKLLIKAHPNAKVIATRFHRYYKFLHQVKDFDNDKKLIRVNYFVNKIISKYDTQTNSWSTPKEFLINGYGDCEDYALTKYYTLKQLNFSQENLFLAVVKVKGSKTLHMITLYKNEAGELLSLDNLSWKLLPVNKRTDLIFKFAFNEHNSFSLKNGKLIKELKTRPEVEFFKEYRKRL